MKLDIELTYDPEPGCDPWFVCVRGFRGCMSQGATAWEALDMIHEALLLWLEVGEEDCQLDMREAALYAQLSQEATREEVSNGETARCISP